MNAELFAYWYITIFLTAFGVAMLVRSRQLASLNHTFRCELRDPVLGPRLGAVLGRRQEIEGLGGRPMMIAGASYIFFGLLCGFHVVAPTIACALAYVGTALVLATAFSRVRNTSEKRAASLSPRTQTAAVPMFGYLGAAVAACLPLVLVTIKPLQLASILVFAASVVILFAAWWTASMAAVLVGDDIDLELYVDDRVRRSRVSSMLSLGYAIVPVFFAVATPYVVPARVFYATFIASLILLFGYFAWLLIDRIRGRFALTSKGVQV